MKKPQHIGDSFDSYLQKKQHQKQANSQAPSSYSKQARSVSLPVYEQSQLASQTSSLKQSGSGLTSDEKKMFSHKTQLLLEQFSGVEQKKILKFWYEMTISFGSKFRYEYGDEPNRHVMKFASQLDEFSYQRLKDNLDERLKKGQEWPPTVAALETLKDSPTDREILEARTNILTLKQPQSRVEKYLVRRKSAKLRTLSDQYLAKEFKTLYLEAFEEVVLHDYDVILDEKEHSNDNAKAQIQLTELDHKIATMAEQGIKPSGSLGERLARIEKLRQQQQ